MQVFCFISNLKNVFLNFLWGGTGIGLNFQLFHILFKLLLWSILSFLKVTVASFSISSGCGSSHHPQPFPQNFLWESIFCTKKCGNTGIQGHRMSFYELWKDFNIFTHCFRKWINRNGHCILIVFIRILLVVFKPVFTLMT